MGGIWPIMSIAMDTEGILFDQNPHWSSNPPLRHPEFPFERQQLHWCEARLSDASSPRALALIGLRHVGKTVILRQLAERLMRRGIEPRRIVYCNLADERWSTPPSPREIVSAVEQLSQRPSAPVFFLFDEIQVFSGWHAWLKLAVDEGVHRFVVTGSAASSIRDGARESGYGRWDEVSIEPLTFGEFVDMRGDSRRSKERVDVDPSSFGRFLRCSGFPAHAFEERAALVRQRLREDIVDRAIARDLHRLHVDVDQARRLFLWFAENSGAELNMQDRAKDLDVDRKSIAKWLDILLDTRLLVELQATTTRQGRGPGKASTLKRQAKIYVSDHGIISAFAPIPDPGADPHFRGKMFEALVFRHLREAPRVLREDPDGYARHGDIKISYWPDKEGEIDFVLDTRTERIAIEVTASAKVDSEKRAKFRRAAERAGATRRVLISAARSAAEHEHEKFVAIDEFALEPLRMLDLAP